MVRVVFADRQFVAAVKPANTLTQGEFDEQVLQWIREKEQRARPFLEVIHRLDKPVSGIVLFARSSKALSRMHASMRNRECQKGYIAWVEGNLAGEALLSHKLLKGDFRTHIDPKGKEAKLAYKVVGHEKNRSLVLIALFTGRYHQIRAQMGHIGHPIVGDEKYGAKTASREILLHHARITIPHPIGNEVMTFVEPPPFAPAHLAPDWVAWYEAQFPKS